MTYSSLSVDSAITDGQKSLFIFVDDPRTKRTVDEALHREYLLDYSDGDEQPLALMENGQFDCVIIDIPESGDEALILLQKLRRYSNDVPVIMMCNIEKTLKSKINKYELDNLLSNDSYDDNVIEEIYPNRRATSNRTVS